MEDLEKNSSGDVFPGLAAIAENLGPLGWANPIEKNRMDGQNNGQKDGQKRSIP